MQNILNKKDRTDAFLKFLFFFLLTTGLVIAAAYFNFKVPERHYSMLRTQARMSEERDHFQTKFASRAKGVYQLLDTVQKEPANYEQLFSELSVNLTALQETNRLAQVDGVNGPDDAINSLLVTTMFKVKSQYDQLHKLNAELQKLNALEKQVSEYKQELQLANDRIKQLELTE